MNGGTIFVLFLAAGFFFLVAYLAVKSRRDLKKAAALKDELDRKGHDRLAS